MMLRLPRNASWMSRFDTPGRVSGVEPLGMKHRTSNVLYSYWNELRAGRLAPQRLEIEPSRIVGILSDTFMLERVDAATYQFRLAGTRLCELFGSELRGRNFLDDWSTEDRAWLVRDLTTVCEQGAVAVLGFEGSSDNRHRVELEAVLLPLVHGTSKIGRLMGAISTASSPHWLDSEPLRRRRLLRRELIWPDGRPHSVIERLGRQAPFLAARAQLRVVKPARPSFRVLEGGRTDRGGDKI
jgi:hypothetical protein